MFSSNATQVSDAAYIEDVFSTWLYTGNSSTQTITNGIDLAGKGGLVWVKQRSSSGFHRLYDTARGTSSQIYSNSSEAAGTQAELSSFNNNGFTLTSLDGNFSPHTYASWTFREQPKFFDVVTYTGDGAVARAISHNLGSAPGCMIVKRTNAAGDWRVYHIGCSANNGLLLNTADAQVAAAPFWFGDGSTTIPPTSTQFTVNSVFTNNSGDTYIAYLFAHDAGGFGATGADNVISCGSYAGTGASGQVVTLGWEPQWVLIKSTNTAFGWYMFDTMRGMAFDPQPGPSARRLFANLGDAETGSASGASVYPTATGFGVNGGGDGVNQPGGNYIYIAIRRGPMRTPTSGTSVFSPVVRTGTGSATTVSAGFPPDFGLCQGTALAIGNQVQDRLRGATLGLRTQTDAAETSSATDALTAFGQNGINVGSSTTSSYWNNSGVAYVNYFLRRAPGFFDVVCYSGNSVAGRAITHNLTVAPEFLIVKRRSGVDSWYCYAQTLGNAFDMVLNSTRAASSTDDIWFSTSPTSTNFTVRQYDAVNGSGNTYVAYLFASCPGVSKVGSFTGTGATQVINCGFTAGARFVLIKRTDSTGNWFVWDSARGIVAGNDPYLLLNSTAAEVTNTDWVDTAASGFELSNAGGNDVNINGASYIFLAIA